MNDTAINPGSGSSGSLIGSIIVVIILIIGAIYLFSNKTGAPVAPVNPGADVNAPALSTPTPPPAPPAAVEPQVLEDDANLVADDSAAIDQDLKALDQNAGL